MMLCAAARLGLSNGKNKLEKQYKQAIVQPQLQFYISFLPDDDNVLQLYVTIGRLSAISTGV